MTLPASARNRLRAMDPQRVDLLIAGLFVAESLVELRIMRGASGVGWAALCMLAIAVGLALRRRAPFAAIALGMAAFLAFQPLGKEVNDHVYASFFAVLFLLFSFGLQVREGRHMAAGIALAFVVSLVGTSIDAYPNTLLDLLTG